MDIFRVMGVFLYKKDRFESFFDVVENLYDNDLEEDMELEKIMKDMFIFEKDYGDICNVNVENDYKVK